MSQLEELPLEGVPRRLFMATPSKLDAWLSCPKSYRMRYVDVPTPPRVPGTAVQSVGSSIHNALRDWMLLPRAERTPTAARQLVYDNWVDAGFRDAEQSSAQRMRAGDLVVAYVEQTGPDVEPWAVERKLSALEGEFWLWGKVDRLDRRDGELVVVDYKTGRAALTADDARGSTALALYAIAATRMFKQPCRTVELHHIPTGDVHQHVYSDESLERHLGRIVATATEARDATDYPANPGPRCAFCDFRSSCTEGLAASSARDTWAGLDEGEDAS